MLKTGEKQLFIYCFDIEFTVEFALQKIYFQMSVKLWCLENYGLRPRKLRSRLRLLMNSSFNLKERRELAMSSFVSRNAKLAKLGM